MNMKRKRIIICVAAGVVGTALIMCAVAVLLGHKHLLLASPKLNGVPASNILGSNVSAMQQWVSRINQPKDKQMYTCVPPAIERAGQLWQEWQTLVESGNVRIRPWQGVDITSGVWESPDGKTKIFLIFRSKRGQISESTKRIYSTDGRVEQFYCLAYYEDSGTIKYCNLDNREVLFFYPGNKISSYARKVDPAKEGYETWYEIEWDENGKIIREQTRTFEIPMIPKKK